MFFSTRDTKTAEIEGLWLINRPKCFGPEYPDNSPKVWWCSPFIVPSLYSMRDPHDIMKWHHNHLLWSSSGKTTAHVHQNCWCSSAHPPASSPEPQLLWMHPNLFVFSLTQFSCLWHIYIFNARFSVWTVTQSRTYCSDPKTLTIQNIHTTYSRLMN